MSCLERERDMYCTVLLTLACKQPTNAAQLLSPQAPIIGEHMCWLVLHCRPGLGSARWQGEREGRTETAERHQGINAQHSASFLFPTTISSLTTHHHQRIRRPNNLHQSHPSRAAESTYTYLPT
jgi:hypothetical protein